MLALLRVQYTSCLVCCDSNTKQSDVKLTTERKVAESCKGISHITMSRFKSSRDKGLDGNECDFCMVETFFISAVAADAAVTDPPSRKVNTAKKDGVAEKVYYLQSCGSFKPSLFEYNEAGIPENQLKDSEQKEQGTKEKMDHVNTGKWMKLYSDFGTDLTTFNNKTKRICNIRENRGGYTLDTKNGQIGLNEPAYNGDNIAAEDDDDGVVDISTFSSIICACFDDKCNGKTDIIPEKKDLERTPLDWNYGKTKENK